MLHRMKLTAAPFEKIRNGGKTIELRLNDIKSDDPMIVFGYPDAFKLRSCMTLFSHAAPEQKLFQRVLDKFCRGTEDDETVDILHKHV